MDEEYLISKVGNITIGLHCKDVTNVYTQQLKITKLFYLQDIYLGITTIKNSIVHIVDFSKRILIDSQASAKGSTERNIIMFHTSLEKNIAILVDHIIGLKPISSNSIVKSSSNFNNKQKNIHLLFPYVAKMSDGKLIYLMDVTYVDFIDAIEDNDGELDWL